MSPRRAVAWLKEWGGLLGALCSLGLALFLALGFGMTTPAKLFAQLEARVAALEAQAGDLQAVLRFLCYFDRDKAGLAGIRGCPQANNLPGR